MAALGAIGGIVDSANSVLGFTAVVVLFALNQVFG
jgi:hypothetical protein